MPERLASLAGSNLRFEFHLPNVLARRKPAINGYLVRRRFWNNLELQALREALLDAAEKAGQTEKIFFLTNCLGAQSENHPALGACRPARLSMMKRNCSQSRLFLQPEELISAIRVHRHRAVGSGYHNGISYRRPCGWGAQVQRALKVVTSRRRRPNHRHRAVAVP